MFISIHQPEHLPWPGFFNKIKSVDQFVILDDVEFRKGYYHNRNKILNNVNEEEWVTIPIIKSSNKDKINQKKIKIDDFKKINFYKNKIFDSYKNTDYFKLYEEEFFSIYEEDYKYLIDLNLSLINFFLKKLQIDTKIIKSSSLDVVGNKSNLILEICKKLKGTKYLSGVSGKNYLDLESFRKENIKVVFQKYDYPQYKKNFKFPNLSTIDILFRLGPEAKKFI